MRWDLDDIYPSFEGPEFACDVQKASVLAKRIGQWGEADFAGDAGAALEAAVRALEQYQLLLDRALSFCFLRQSVDSEDASALAWIEKLAALDAEAMPGVSFFRKRLLGLGEGLEAAIAGRPALAEFAYFLRYNRDSARYMLPGDVEKALSLMEITGSRAWSNLHNTLTSTLTAEMHKVDGTTSPLTLPEVRNLAYDAVAETRRRAYEAELASYPAVETPVAAALCGIKGESITKSRMRGFTSPLDQTLFSSRMDRETLEALIGAMEEYLPVFRGYFKAKAKLLGKERLPFYDLFAPVGSLSRSFTVEEARSYLVEGFASFNPKMADFIDEAFARRWIDTEPRRGKQGGAFCSTVHAAGQPRILMNFDGSFNAVSTLAHELGHGYHGFCLKDASILNTSYPMPLAETASIFNETFITGLALDRASGDGERLAMLDEQLINASQIVVDILSRYYFESEVFARRESSLPGAEELRGVMLDAQKRAYGDGLDESLLHPWMWVCKGHYYMDINFYNFPYAFGLLFGLGVYGLYGERGAAFLPDYDALLSATGRDSVAGVCASVGIDVRSLAFWRTSLEVLRGKVEAYRALAGLPGAQ